MRDQKSSGMSKKFGNSGGKWGWSISTERYYSFKYCIQVKCRVKSRSWDLSQNRSRNPVQELHASLYSDVSTFWMALSSARSNFQTSCTQLHTHNRKQSPGSYRSQWIPAAVHSTSVFWPLKAHPDTQQPAIWSIWCLVGQEKYIPQIGSYALKSIRVFQEHK